MVNLVGGVEKYEQWKHLVFGCDFIIATPGRLIDLLSKAVDVSNVKIVVLDEADKMLSIGFGG